VPSERDLREEDANLLGVYLDFVQSQLLEHRPQGRQMRLEALGVDDGVVDERPCHCPQLPEDLVHQPLEQRRRVLGTEGGAQEHVDVVVAPKRQLVLILLSDPDLVVPHPEVQRGEAVAPPRNIEQLVCDRHRILVRHSFVVVWPVIPADTPLRPISLRILLPGHNSMRHRGVLFPRRQLQFADEPGRHPLLAVGFEQVVLIQGQASLGRKYHLVVGEVHFKLYPLNGRVAQVINGSGKDFSILLQQLNDGRPLHCREPRPDLLVAPLFAGHGCLGI
jgi:hypothetical protein